MYPNPNPTVDALGAGPRTALILTLLVTLVVAIVRVATLA
jgi:hypothetical protein